MIDNDSRYYDIDTADIETSSKGRISYKLRRFLPAMEELEIQGEVTVIDGMRPDLIASKTLGDSLQFWQICDANNCMNPFDLTSEIGKKLKIAVKKVGL